MGGKDVYKCTKCCRPYKLPSALNKHEAKCVPRVNRDALHLPGTSINQELVKVTHASREQTTKAERNAKRPRQKKRSAESTDEVKQKKERVKSLLEQADEEARWQLIRCNINEILDDSLGSQLQQVTQQIPNSKLSTKHQTNSWWSAAKHSPPRVHLSRSSTVVTEEINQLNDESAGNDGADGTVGDANVATVATSYRERTTLMSKLKGSVCSTPQPEMLHSSSKVKSVTCTPLTSKSLVNNELFSDIQIKTSGGETVNGHKAFFYLAYPTMGPFLQGHSQICLSSLSSSDVIMWLEAVYTGDWDSMEQRLTTASLEVISRFIEFSYTWTKENNSHPYLTSAGDETGAKISKEKRVKKKKRAAGADVDITGGDGSAELAPPPNKPAKGKRKKTTLNKYPPLFTVSPLLSTIGLNGDVITDTDDVTAEQITPPLSPILAVDTEILQQGSGHAGSDITGRARSDITDRAGSDITNRAGSDIIDRAGSDITNKAGSDITDRAGSDITDKAGRDITDKTGSDITNRTGNGITNKAGNDITGKVGSDITGRVKSDITNRSRSDITDRAVVESPQMSSSFEGPCQYLTPATSRSPTTPDVCADAVVGELSDDLFIDDLIGGQTVS